MLIVSISSSFQYLLPWSCSKVCAFQVGRHRICGHRKGTVSYRQFLRRPWGRQTQQGVFRRRQDAHQHSRRHCHHGGLLEADHLAGVLLCWGHGRCTTKWVEVFPARGHCGAWLGTGGAGLSTWRRGQNEFVLWRGLCLSCVGRPISLTVSAVYRPL